MSNPPQTFWQIFSFAWRTLRPWMRYYVIALPVIWIAPIVWSVVDDRLAHRPVDIGAILPLLRSGAFWSGATLMVWSISIGTATREAMVYEAVTRRSLWFKPASGAALKSSLPDTPPHGIQVVVQPLLAGVGAASLGVGAFLNLEVFLKGPAPGSHSLLFGTDITVYFVFAALMLLVASFGARSSVRRVFVWSQAQAAREAAARAELQRAQLLAFQAAMEPKLLSWTLGRVSALAETDGPTAERTIEKLSIVLRHALARSQQPLSTVADEIAFTQEYLAIEEERLSDRLRVSYSVDPQTARLKVSTRCLQPLVEDAIDHAAEAQPMGAALKIGTTLDGRWLRLFVEDDRPGLSKKDPEGDSLRELRQQLDTQYGFRAGVTIQSEPGHTRVTITVPASSI